MSLGLDSVHPDLAAAIIRHFGGAPDPMEALMPAPPTGVTLGPSWSGPDMGMLQPDTTPVFTPAQQLGAGPSFLDRFAGGLDGIQAPTPNPFSSGGNQFLTAMLGGAAKGFSASRLKDVAAKQKIQDALDERSKDINRRSADVSDQLAVARGTSAVNEAAAHRGALSRAALAEQADAAAADRNKTVPIPRSLAVAMKAPEKTGTLVSTDTFDALMKGYMPKPRGGPGGPTENWTRADIARRKSNLIRIGQMDRATTADYALLASGDSEDVDAAAIRAGIAKRARDAEALYAENEALDAKYDSDGAAVGPDVAAGAVRNLEANTPIGGPNPFTGAAAAPAAAASDPHVSLIELMRSRGITNRAQASAYLQHNAAAVRGHGLNAEAILRAFP